MVSEISAKGTEVQCEGERYFLHIDKPPTTIALNRIFLEILCHLIIECDGDPKGAMITYLNGKFTGPKLKDCGVSAVVLNNPAHNGFICQIWPCGYTYSHAFEVVLTKSLFGKEPVTLTYQVLREALMAVNKRPKVHDKKVKDMPTTELPAISEQELNVIRVLCAVGGKTNPDNWDTFIAGAKTSFQLESRQVQNALQRLKDQKKVVILTGTKQYEILDFEAMLSSRSNPDTPSFKIVVEDGKLLEPADEVLVTFPSMPTDTDEVVDDGLPVPPASESTEKADPLDLLVSLEGAIAPYITYLKALVTAEEIYNETTTSEEKIVDEISQLEESLARLKEELPTITSRKEEAWAVLERLNQEAETPGSEIAAAKAIYESGKSLFTV